MAEFKTVVVGTDFSDLSKAAYRSALRLTKGVSGARVHLVHVVPTSPAATSVPYVYSTMELEVVRDRARGASNEYLKKLQGEAEGQEVTTETRFGPPARELQAAADEVDADLSVVASHGSGAFMRAVLGSVSSSLIRMSSRPVMIVGKDRNLGDKIDNVIAAVDLSPISGRVLEIAADIGAHRGAMVHVLTLCEPPITAVSLDGIYGGATSAEDMKAFEERTQADLDRMAEPYRDKVKVQTTAIAKAPPANAIVEAATMSSADMIVIGTSGHGALYRAFLGSTATRVVAQAPCPVLVVPQSK